MEAGLEKIYQSKQEWKKYRRILFAPNFLEHCGLTFFQDKTYFYPNVSWTNLFLPKFFRVGIFFDQIYLNPKTFIPQFFWGTQYFLHSIFFGPTMLICFDTIGIKLVVKWNQHFRPMWRVWMPMFIYNMFSLKWRIAKLIKKKSLFIFHVFREGGG